jgi:formylglycine-generating enzyme required for sulfatase activity
MKLKALYFLCTIIIFCFTCEKKPSNPEYINPFDSENPTTKGDPFNLTLLIADGGIRLNWSMPEFPSIKQFNIYRSEQENIGYAIIKTVDKTVMTYLDTAVVNGHTYWYRISVIDKMDKESNYTNTTAIHINTEPIIVINGDDKYTSTLDVSLTILASNAVQMLISNDESFSGAVWENYSSTKDWTLSTNDGEKQVFLKIKYDTGEESIASSDLILLDTTPPIPYLWISPDSGITNETNFSFDPTNSSDNISTNEEMKLRFDWNNDGEFDTGWIDIETVLHEYSVGGGNKTVKMVLKDAVGWQDSVIRNIFVNTRPNASFTVDRDNLYHKLYYFDASGSSDVEDGSDLEYRWDFESDGTWDAEYTLNDTTSHIYEEAGEYMATLSIRDKNNLTAESSNQLTVKFFIDMVRVEGGTFTMGDTWGDGDADELPTHQVTLSSFYMSIFEITEGHLEETLGIGVVTGYDYPVCLSWEEIIEFCNRLSENEGLTPCYPTDSTCNFDANGYRLPTEAEWEFAARGGNLSKGTKFSGSDTSSLVGWFGSNHPVGQKRPNELGIYDMTGNVHEKCWDSYGPYSADVQIDPTGPEGTQGGVFRGGYYYASGRVAERNWGPGRPPGGVTGCFIGFRIVRSIRD